MPLSWEARSSVRFYNVYRQVCEIPQTLHFEPSLDVLSLRPDVMSSIKIFSFRRTPVSPEFEAEFSRRRGLFLAATSSRDLFIDPQNPGSHPKTLNRSKSLNRLFFDKTLGSGGLGCSVVDYVVWTGGGQVVCEVGNSVSGRTCPISILRFRDFK